MQLRRVIISGGGTGGHIFPAIAIADSIKEMFGDVEILFIGAKGRMEMEKVPAAGYKIEGLWISGLQRSLTIKNLMFPLKVIASLIKARRIVKKFQPQVVIGVGGYASGPTLRVATKLKIPTLIQEQNSYPGITNKLLAKKVNKICVAYDGMEKFFPREKIMMTGNPVREKMVKLDGKREKAFEHFGLDSNKKTLLIIGGSLGARSINHSIKEALPLLKENDVQVLWQTGKLFVEEAAEAIQQNQANNIKSTDFITRMDYAYSVADLVVSRAGAIAVSELCLVKKPCILVPLPSAAEDHQTKNALALVNHNAAILMKDSEAFEQLGTKVVGVINDIEQRESLEKNIADLGFQNATEAIRGAILEIAAE